MKPNDKAYEAALNAFYMTRAEAEHEPNIVCMRRAVNAAYAAHFKSEDYAGLINWLRDSNRHCSTDGPVAADALETVLAERDALKVERDALLARLAPVEDEKLVEIAAKAQWEHAWQDTGGTEEDAIIISGNDWHQFINSARAAIAAIRPHIEAAERERCAKIAETPELWLTDKPTRGCDDIAAAIRSGK